MSDPLRTVSPHDTNTFSTEGNAERDTKIETLILTGLDHYFAADYAQAIDVWSRALFLDRGHARARAYIDRARSAMAEQQRESEEMLHNGIAAFERGEIEAARQLLNAAVQRGAAHDVALAFLTRIDRINAAAPIVTVPETLPARVPSRADADRAHPPAPRWIGLALVAVMAAIAVIAVQSWTQLQSWIPLSSTAVEPNVMPAKAADEPLVVPRSAELALDRAQALLASGRLYDALHAVETVKTTDPLRSAADRLRATIQQELLAHQLRPGRSGSAQP